VLAISSYLPGVINYTQGFTDPSLLLIALLLPTAYGTAGLFLRQRLNEDSRLQSIRDVMNLLATALFAAAVSASAGTQILIWDRNIRRADFAHAASNWWVGDAVALSSLTPFLLQFVLPGVRRYLGVGKTEPKSGRIHQAFNLYVNLTLA
jgi:integral membrane sensor domain MASE1